MHRIDADFHSSNFFVDPNALAGTKGTKVDAAWANAVQEELVQTILHTGASLVKGTYTQLRDAILSMVATHNAVTNPHSAASAATASRLVLRDASGRAQFATPSASADAATKGYVDQFARARYWGSIQVVSGVVSHRDSFGGCSVGRILDVIQIAFPEALADANYCAVLTDATQTLVPGVVRLPFAYSKEVDMLKVTLGAVGTGSPVDLSTGSHAVDYVVFA